MTTRTLSPPTAALPCTSEPPAAPTGSAHRRRKLLIPLVLVLMTAALRAPGLTRPLLGNFATKAAVYGMTARRLARGQAHWAYPQLDVLVGGEPSYHLLECPLSAYLTAVLWHYLEGSLDFWGRLSALIWSSLAVVFLYHLLRRWHGRSAAVGGAALMALSPVSIIYGQSFQLEASLLAFMLASLLGLDCWIGTARRGWAIVFVAAFAATCLTKVYMLYLVPVLLAMIWQRRRTPSRHAPARCRPSPRLMSTALVLAILPSLLWYAHMYRAAESADSPAAGHVYFSLQKTKQVHAIPHPLLKDPDFYKGVLDDLAGVVLTPAGFGLMLIGLLRPPRRQCLIWLASAAVLVLLAPRKFHEMNYYWLAVLPVFCVTAGRGCATIWESLRRQVGHSERAVPWRLGCVAVMGICLITSLRHSIVPAFSTPAEDRAVVAAANAARRLSRPDARVVTVHGTSLDLLYYTDRTGWTLHVPEETSAPAGGGASVELAERIRQGASLLVVADLQSLRRAARFQRQLERYELLQQGDDWAVYRLTTGERADTADVSSSKELRRLPSQLGRANESARRR